jgi:hypothetical protein
MELSITANDVSRARFQQADDAAFRGGKIATSPGST